MATDQKQQKCVQMLSERSADGETLESVIRSAYSQGYYDGIVKAFTVGTKYEEKPAIETTTVPKVGLGEYPGEYTIMDKQRDEWD